MLRGKTCLTKNGKRAFNLISFGTLRNKLQHCAAAPSISLQLPADCMKEEPNRALAAEGARFPRFKLNQLRNAAQQTPTLRSGS